MKTKIFLTLLLYLISIMAFSQVTVGSSAPANKGALLDMKERDPDANNANANKGLALPRVKLNRLTTTTSDLKETIDGTSGDAWDVDEHAGLVVYNISACPEPGVYVWNGAEC